MNTIGCVSVAVLSTPGYGSGTCDYDVLRIWGMCMSLFQFLVNFSGEDN